jgi:hypothetical protein
LKLKGVISKFFWSRGLVIRLVYKCGEVENSTPLIMFLVATKQAIL